MTTYADRTDLENFFSQANITDWADKDRDGSISANEALAIDAAIEAAEGIVDSYLARAGYDVPFEGDTYSALPARLKAVLKQWTVAVAGFHIYAWRGLRDRVNSMERLYKHTIGQLKSLKDTMPLTGMASSARVSSGTGIDTSEPTDALNNLRTDGWNW